MESFRSSGSQFELRLSGLCSQVKACRMLSHPGDFPWDESVWLKDLGAGGEFVNLADDSSGTQSQSSGLRAPVIGICAL